MSGFILHSGATVTCLHSGQAIPTVVSPRVKIGGQPVVTAPTTYMITGCVLPPPPTANGPCLTANFVTSATRVLIDKVPVLLQESTAICTPTMTGLIVVAIQSRVTGQ